MICSIVCVAILSAAVVQAFVFMSNGAGVEELRACAPACFAEPLALLQPVELFELLKLCEPVALVEPFEPVEPDGGGSARATMTSCVSMRDAFAIRDALEICNAVPIGVSVIEGDGDSVSVVVNLSMSPMVGGLLAACTSSAGDICSLDKSPKRVNATKVRIISSTPMVPLTGYGSTK
jgi:hypothetical protein